MSLAFLLPWQIKCPSFRRKTESRETGLTLYVWIPAYAGMTEELFMLSA